MGRKLETEEEKVLPFYASSLTQEEQDDVQAAVVEPPAEPLASVRFMQNLFDSLGSITIKLFSKSRYFTWATQSVLMYSDNV